MSEKLSNGTKNFIQTIKQITIITTLSISLECMGSSDIV